jgi:hypothetical protein
VSGHFTHGSPMELDRFTLRGGRLLGVVASELDGLFERFGIRLGISEPLEDQGEKQAEQVAGAGDAREQLGAVLDMERRPPSSPVLRCGGGSW